MKERTRKTARYRILKEPEGNRYQFFCDISGALVCETEPIFLSTPETELEFAWESEGRRFFNVCHRCGKWVSDAAYNAETFECVDCSPWEEQAFYCPHCGEKTDGDEVFCRKCKNRLRYGNEPSGE